MFSARAGAIPTNCAQKQAAREIPRRMLRTYSR
jgi:hypothetical protein